MNCDQFRRQLHDFLDGSLDAAEVEAVRAHAAHCSGCRCRLAEEAALRAALRALPVPAPRPGFAQQALRNATLPRGQHRQGFWLGFGSALAAGLAFWLLLGTWVLESPVPAKDPLPEVAIVLDEVRNVNLVFNSPRDLDGATLSIDLPPGVELEGFPGERTIAWETALAKGANALSLPLRATSQAGGELVARLEHNGRQKTVRLQLAVRDPMQSRHDRALDLS